MFDSEGRALNLLVKLRRGSLTLGTELGSLGPGMNVSADRTNPFFHNTLSIKYITTAYTAVYKTKRPLFAGRFSGSHRPDRYRKTPFCGSQW
jgi:hypothetical protein